jgi:hypothetical protein
LAFIGIRTRGWWLTVGALILLSLPFLAASLEYPRVVLSSNGGLLYSLNDIHILLIPFIGAVFGSLRYGPDYRLAIDRRLNQLRQRVTDFALPVA